MTEYYIVDKKLDVLVCVYEGNYCEALDYCAWLCDKLGKTADLSEYYDVLTPEEYADEYGEDDEEPDEETQALIRHMCELAAEVELYTALHEGEEE